MTEISARGFVCQSNAHTEFTSN